MQKRFWSGLANRGWNRLAWLVGLGLALLVITIVLPEFPPEAKAASYSCDEAGLNAAIAAGGSATFSCSAATTVTLTGSKNVAKSLSIDGGNLLTIDGASTYKIFSLSAGINFTLANLTLQNGFASTEGGAIDNPGGSNITVTNVTFKSNKAGDTNNNGSGAAIYSGGGTLAVSGATFNGNNTVANGFGSNGEGSGGAIFVSGGTLTVDTSSFETNSAAGSGGAIEVYASSAAATASITRSYFGNNSSGTFGAGGGALDLENFSNSLNASVVNSTFYGNQATMGSSGGGGAINVYGSTLTLNNDTIDNNSVGFNGVEGNVSGGGVDNQGSATVNIANTIVYGNTVNGGTGGAAQDPDVSGAFNSQGNNLIGDTGTATGFTNGVNGDIVGSNPNLAAPANNGGSTKTQAIDTTSPAYNAGNNATCAATDQRGITRPQPTGGTCDIGAFELGSTVQAVDDTYQVVLGSTLNANGVSPNPAGVEANDTVIGGAYGVVTATNPSQASAFTFNGDGTFSYTPQAGASGTDTFTYYYCPTAKKTGAVKGKAVSCKPASNTATVTITIITPPVANPDNYTTIRNTPLNADGVGSDPAGVLGNDSNPNEGTRVVSKVVDVAHGTLTLNTDGTFTYVPANNYVGTDTFQYKFFDGLANSNTTTVTINVTSAPPIANNDNYTTAVATPLTVAAPGVLSNDTDPNTPALPLTAVQVSNPTNGTLIFNQNGSFTYTPNTGFSGTDSFTYKANNGVADSNVATVLITVGKSLPVGTINDASTQEGNSGTHPILFTVSLSAAASGPVTFTYATADGSARAGTDYVAATGTLVIPAGQTSGTISVLVIGNTLVDGNRAFFVNLTSAAGATLGRVQATGTIIDDDVVQPGSSTLTINDVRAREGNSGLTTFVFTVSRAGADSPTPVTVNFATADSTAKAGTDYQPLNGTLSFGPGETSKTITVLVKANTVCQVDRAFLVTLSGASANAIIAKPTGLGTIIDDDCKPELQEADLLPILRVSPDREYGLHTGTLVTYTLVIKNLGPGRASPPAARFPLDPNLELAYATFAQPNSWVEKVVTTSLEPVHDPDAALPYVQIRFPQMLVGDVVTGTLVFRAAPGAQADHSLFTRFVAVWDDDVAVDHHRFSNAVRLTLTDNSLRNDTSGVVQFFTPDVAPTVQDKTGLTHIVLKGDFYAAEERIYLWYTDASAHSTGLGYVYADRAGQVTLDLYVKGLQPGQSYIFVGLGARTAITGSAVVHLAAPVPASKEGGTSQAQSLTYQVSGLSGDSLRQTELDLSHFATDR